MRRAPLLVLLAAASCSSEGTSPLDVLRRRSTQDAPITREAADAQPYASILARQDGGRPALLILQSAGAPGVGPARLTWLSADRQAIATQGGRVVATGGGRRNLATTMFQDADPMLNPLQVPVEGIHARRAVDVLPGTDRDAEPRFGLQLDCRLTPEADETIVILDREHDVRRIVERCSGGGSSHVNRFWADLGTGFVWRSEQWTGPDLPRVTIEVLKPAED